MPTPAEERVAEAKTLESTDPDAAEASYREALALAPNDPKATIGLARLLLAQGRIDESRSLITELERRGPLDPEGERFKAELTVRGQAKQSGSLEAARAAEASNPGDLNLKLQLAEALAAAGQYEEALESSLELVERGRKEVREAARKLMLNIFQLLPADSELVSDYRRRLAAALF
jgi:putative thioredoxin